MVIKFNEQMLRKRKPKVEPTSSHLLSDHFEQTQQGRVKYTATVISKEINKVYHPFRFLCKKFGEMVRVDEELACSCFNEEAYEVKEKYFQKLIREFCKYLVHGCIGLYKKWIMEYTGVEEKKYEKWMTSIAMNEMWEVSEHSLRNSAFEVLEIMKVPLKIEVDALVHSISYLSPQDFAIDPELRIEGHYFKAIYELSELPSQWRPGDLIRHLEKIKNCICLDVDAYHRQAEKG